MALARLNEPGSHQREHHLYSQRKSKDLVSNFFSGSIQISTQDCHLLAAECAAYRGELTLGCAAQVYILP